MRTLTSEQIEHEKTIEHVQGSPLEFPLGNGDPGPHDSIEIWGLWVFNV